MLFECCYRLLHTIVTITPFLIFSLVFTPMLVEANPIPNVFINEIHYDNDGADINEYVEIAVNSKIDLSDWSLRLYNGKGGKEGKSFSLNNWSYFDADINSNFSFLSIKTKGLQNGSSDGSPDGLALFMGKNLIQFLSYEGVFKATSGFAMGLTSVDIGVSEPSNTPVGFSLQLTGQGTKYSDFSWSAPQKNTFRSINTGQQFVSFDKQATSAKTVDEPSSLQLFAVFLMLIFYYHQKYSLPSTLRPFDELRTQGN